MIDRGTQSVIESYVGGQIRTGLRLFVEDLKKNGFRVYSYGEITNPEKPEANLFIERYGKIGKVCKTILGYGFETLHKPDSELGIGYVLYQDGEPSIDRAEEAISVSVPSWAKRKCKPVKYNGIEEFKEYLGKFDLGLVEL